MRILWVAISAQLILSGCVSTPSFDQVSGVTPKTIVDTIECELIAARNRIEARRRASGKGQSLCDYVAVVELSLQVDEQMALAPSFTHTNVVSKSLTRAFDWGLKLDTQSQRTFSQDVSFEIRKLDLNKDRRCDRPAGGVSLNGDLGLEEVIDMGFQTIDPTDAGIRAAEDSPDIGCPLSLDVRPPLVRGAPQTRRAAKGKKHGGEGRKENVFSTHVEFVLLRNINSTGPTWTLQSFRGPGKLFSSQRTDTHGVTVGFARADQRGGVEGAKEAARRQNLDAKQDSLRGNIRQLQQLLP